MRVFWHSSGPSTVHHGQLNGYPNVLGLQYLHKEHTRHCRTTTYYRMDFPSSWKLYPRRIWRKIGWVICVVILTIPSFGLISPRISKQLDEKLFNLIRTHPMRLSYLYYHHIPVMPIDTSWTGSACNQIYTFCNHRLTLHIAKDL